MEDGGRLRLKRAVRYTMSLIVLMWCVKLLETASGYDFSGLGILPRTLTGSVGILTAPFIHGDFFHLFSNTIPLMLLGVGIFYFHDKVALYVVLIIYFMTGVWVWMMARDAYHIGASGLVYGLLFYLLVSGFISRSRHALAISFVILVLYGGGFAYGLIPRGDGISWESHLMGAISGVFCAIYFRKVVRPAQATEHEITYSYTYIEKKPDDPSEVYTYTYRNSSSDDR